MNSLLQYEQTIDALLKLEEESVVNVACSAEEELFENPPDTYNGEHKCFKCAGIESSQEKIRNYQFTITHRTMYSLISFDRS